MTIGQLYGSREKNKKLPSGAIRITLRFMLMPRCRAMQMHPNMSDCEQAPISQFGASSHRSLNPNLEVSYEYL